MSRTMANEKNYAAWSHDNVVKFYTGQRHRVEDLYTSERVLLVPAVTSCRSVLDVGCAAGGFYQIFQTLKPGIRYVGVDAVADMVAVARRRYPSVTFKVNEGIPLPFGQETFDLVLCTSVLHHNPNYRDMIRECYRVASRGCVIDLPRLVTAPYAFDRSTSYMVLKHRFHEGAGEIDEQQTIVPYVLENPQPMFEFLLEGLRPRPCAIAAVGYYGHPNESVVLPVKPICFCVVYLLKGDAATTRTELLLDVPEDIEAQLSLSGIERVEGGRVAIPGFIQGV